MSTLMQDHWPWREPLASIKRGAFIVIEGLDRAGKTTQVKRLCDKLYSSGYNVKTIRFPDRTSPTGKLIDSYLQNSLEVDDHAIHLLFSANRWEKAKWIEVTLSAGYTIVCDRYSFSGVAYSAAKNNPSLNLQWALSSDIGLPNPDAVIFLDLDPQEAEKRAGYGTEKYEKKEFQERIRAIFKNLFSSSPNGNNIHVIDASPSVEIVENRIFVVVNDILKSVSYSHNSDKDEKV